MRIRIPFLIQGFNDKNKKITGERKIDIFLIKNAIYLGLLGSGFKVLK
jgi:hypothetical protein